MGRELRDAERHWEIVSGHRIKNAMSFRDGLSSFGNNFVCCGRGPITLVAAPEGAGRSRLH
jgi:hypothetical protein